MRTALTLVTLLFVALCSAGPLAAEDIDYRTHYRTALEVYDGADHAGYLTALLDMVEAMPPINTSPADNLNRPFLQYHVARGHALAGDHETAIQWLNLILEEGIEGLMISQAIHDSAFNLTRQTRAWRQLQRKTARVPILTTPLGGPLYALEGAGCTLIASVGPDGTLLVDSGYAPASRAIRRALRRLGSYEIKWIVNTHNHDDHVGGNLELGQKATIIAHPLTRKAMAESQTFIDQELPPHPKGALPNTTIAQASAVHINGEEVRIIPLPGHTEGDVIVHFTRSRVIHMGDRFFPDPAVVTFTYPGTDLFSYMTTMDTLVENLSDDGLVVSGHSPAVAFSYLKESHDALNRAITWVQGNLDDGYDLEAMKAQGAPEEWAAWSKGRQNEWMTFIHDALVASAPGNL